MITRQSGVFVTTIAAVALTIVFGPVAGVAAASPRSTTPAGPAPAATAGKGAIATSPPAASAPKGYVIVNTGSLDNPAGQESFGGAYCPAGTVVWGGGVTSSGGLEQTVNSSFPSTSGTAFWEVYIDNAGSSDDSFTVYAVCAKKPKKYVIEGGGSVTSPPGEQTPVSATCPAKTVVLGGGGYSNSVGSRFSINSTFPAGNQWISDMNNASGSTGSVTTYAICGKKPSHYVIVTGGTTDNPPESNSTASASCPSKTSILSAGAISSANETSVSLNELNADGGALAYEANASASDHTLNVYAVCAK